MKNQLQTCLSIALSSTNNCKVWLDLKDTIIESWDIPTIINANLIAHFLRTINVNCINIFSFAVWTPEDQRVVNAKLKNSIESSFGGIN